MAGCSGSLNCSMRPAGSTGTNSITSRRGRCGRRWTPRPPQAERRPGDCSHMRIVQLVETLEVGGLERVAVDLALGLNAAGHHVAVYCLFGAGPMRGELDARSIPVVEFHKERHGKASVVWNLARQLRQDEVQVV